MLPDADTKVERRASVRPSAFGAPRKSDAPPARDADAGSSAALGPHERVLEAARLLDALHRSRAEANGSPRPDSEAGGSANPTLLDADLDATPIQRLPHQRARGADELVARSARAQGASEAPGAQAQPLVSSAQARSAARSVQAASTRLARKPLLSLLLFAGMIALSVVPLLRYAVGNEEGTPAARAATPVSRAGLATAATNPGLQQERSTHPVQVGPSSSGVERERAIASALSDGSRALEAGDVSAAERMFGQVLELAEDNHRAAYGLSRIRLKQNNLSGAEGWIQLALRKRPRRAAYHTLYAEVLTRMGRLGEARQELALAQANDEARNAESERTTDQGTNADSDER